MPKLYRRFCGIHYVKTQPMENLFALLIAPAMLVGVVGGVLVAMVFHWLAPAGTDTTAAGAWFV